MNANLEKFDCSRVYLSLALNGTSLFTDDIGTGDIWRTSFKLEDVGLNLVYVEGYYFHQ